MSSCFSEKKKPSRAWKTRFRKSSPPWQVDLYISRKHSKARFFTAFRMTREACLSFWRSESDEESRVMQSSPCQGGIWGGCRYSRDSWLTPLPWRRNVFSRHPEACDIPIISFHAPKGYSKDLPPMHTGAGVIYIQGCFLSCWGSRSISHFRLSFTFLQTHTLTPFELWLIPLREVDCWTLPNKFAGEL